MSSVYSDTNGVWLSVEDLRGTTFGADEGYPTFRFDSDVTFDDRVFFNSDVNFTGPITFSNIVSFLADVTYKGLELDDRFVNRRGDTMLGELDMGTNRIFNIASLNTGQGDNLLYPMDQAVLTSSGVTFNTVTTNSNVNVGGTLFVNTIRPLSGGSVVIALG